jgi:hypothetical protein
LDDDYSSVVSITNVGSQTTQFVSKVYYNGGTYTLGMRELAVGETATYDIRKLRDQRVTDVNGNMIPTTATVGQFTWSILRATDATRLNGRSEVTSRLQRASSSYSCPVCCPNTGPGYSVNGGVVPYVDGFSNNGINEDWIDCYGRDVRFPGIIPGLHVADSSIASAVNDGNGMMITEGLNVGVTEWESDIYNYYFFWDDGMDCYPQYDYREDSGPITVVPNINIQAIKGVGKNRTAKIRVEVSNNSNNSPITLTLSRNSGATVRLILQVPIVQLEQ